MNASQRAAVSFRDVAASFSEEDWDVLGEEQRTLYRNIMLEIHGVLRGLGYRIENSGVLFRIVSRKASSQEGLGPDIMLRINYQEPGDPSDEMEKSEQKVIKTETNLLATIKEEKDEEDIRVPITSMEPDGRSPCISGLVLHPLSPMTVKEEAAEDGGGDPNLTETTSKSWSSGDSAPEQTGRDRTRRRRDVTRQIKSLSALHDTESKESEVPRHPRLVPKCEAGFTGIKLPVQEEIYPISFQQQEEIYPISFQQQEEIYPISFQQQEEIYPISFQQQEEIYPISFQQQGQTFIICSECGKTFCNNSNFQAHMRTHSGERPYKCAHCVKTFLRGSHLKIHLRTHTGERPYKCTHCDKSFRDKSCFARHQRIHTGEKPYQCATCGKYFRKKSNLSDHQRIHTGERPYKCKHCDKTFHQRSNHRVHERNHHADS